MEYCFTTDIDLFETFKAFTPYILAIVVYLVWHRQKGKEVLANEAKENIKSITELSMMQLDIIDTLTKRDINRIKEKSKKYYDDYHKITRNLHFLYRFSDSKTKKYIEIFRENSINYGTYISLFNNQKIDKLTEEKYKDIIKELNNLYAENYSNSRELVKLLSKYAFYKKL